MVLIYWHLPNKRKCNFPHTTVKAVKEKHRQLYMSSKALLLGENPEFPCYLGPYLDNSFYFLSTPYYLLNEVIVLLPDQWLHFLSNNLCKLGNVLTYISRVVVML